MEEEFDQNGVSFRWIATIAVAALGAILSIGFGILISTVNAQTEHLQALNDKVTIIQLDLATMKAQNADLMGRFADYDQLKQRVSHLEDVMDDVQKDIEAQTHADRAIQTLVKRQVNRATR